MSGGGATRSSTRSTSGASADANGDGIGDLAGVRERLPYLRDLGVDALWFNPWYPSPLADTGYDIADYRAIDPAFGTLAGGRAADRRGPRARDPDDRRHRPEPRLEPAPVVPRGARLAARFARAGALLVPARHRTTTASCRRTTGSRSSAGPPGRASTDGEWYLHLFAPEQPDLNWTHRDVWHEHEDVLRFWFDRGVAGVRIDSAALLVKDPELAEEPPDGAPGEHPFMDRDTLHDIYRALARDRRRLCRAARARRRDLAAGRGAVRALPPPGRAAHRVQLRLPRVPVGAGTDAHVDRVGARRARSRRRADDVGALEPRRHPAGHTLRPRRHRVRLRVEAGRHADRPRARRRGARERPPCSRWRCPARCTSTRARSSACRRSRTSRSSAGRIRCGSAPAASTPAATAAASRCPGRETRPPYGFSRDGAERALARPARRLGAAHRRGRVRGRDVDAHSLPRRPAPAARDAVGRATAASAGSRPPIPCSRSRAAKASSASSTSARIRSNFRPDADVLIASDELEGGALPQDTTVWLRQAQLQTTRVPHQKNKEGTMKSTRKATTAAVIAGEPAGRVRRRLDLERRRQERGGPEGHDQRRIADPGQHHGGQSSSSTTRSPSSRRPIPSITVKSVEYQWTGPTFAAKLAAGTLPTVFTVPFTDARTLGDNGQLADLTQQAKALPYFSKYNPAVIAEGIDSKGKIVALPTAAYAQALHYNRKLFTQAGLNPNKPPTTWGQLRSRRQADRAEDRQGRLRRDGQGRQHRRLDPDDARLRARRADGDRHRHEGHGDAGQPADRHGAEHAEDDALDGQLDGLQLRLRLERHQPGVRRRAPSACTSAAPTSTRTSSRRATSTRASTASTTDPAREEQERRRPRRRHAGGGPAERARRLSSRRR